jgi:hypothetical protein
MRLGDYLLNHTIITQEELDEALQAQLLQGGHLGTCLMELGHLGEEDLGEALAAISACPYISIQQLRNVRSSVVEQLPARVAETYHAVPVAFEDQALRVAMIDPNNLPAQDAISFATGLDTRPGVAPEARILQALERFYEIPRRHRYVHLCRRLDSERIQRKIRPGLGSRIVVDAAAGAAGDDHSGTGVIDPAGSAANALDRGGPPPAPATSGSRPPLRLVTRDEIEDHVSEPLCRAETVEEIANVVLDEAARGMAHTILFMVKGGSAVIGRSRGLDLDEERAHGLSFPIAAEPVFSLFLGEGFFRGPLPEDPRYRGFFDTLDLPIPTELMVLPVHIDDRLVALFYGDHSRSTGIQGDMSHYRMLLRKLALGLSLVTIKSKIRSF